VPQPPTDISVVVSDLKAAGVEFKPLTGTLFSTEQASLPVVWTWNKESLRIPGFELKLARTEKALVDETAAKEKFMASLNKANEALAKVDEREKAHVDKEVNYNKQLDEKDKQIVAAKVNGWIKVGIAIPVTYGLTRLLNK
jgi:septal ring factor EnvC (AmiA/AmiB activator)